MSYLASNGYQSILGIYSLNLDVIETSDLIVDSTYITVNGHNFTFPGTTDDTLVTQSDAQNMTNKTITSPIIIGGTIDNAIAYHHRRHH